MKEWLAAIGLLIGIALCPGSIASPLAKDTTTYPDWEPESETTLKTVELETVLCPLLEINDKNPDRSKKDANTEASANLLPHIPEPMVFDLIRPLGARKGELEMNALFLKPTRRRTSLEWASEIEYAFLDNHALELELPFENMRLEELKLAYQATFGDKLEHRFIHGMQILNHYNLDKKNITFDKLYIWGYKFNKRWSTLVMGGLRTSYGNRQVSFSGLLNPSLFYSFSEWGRFGVETNLELTRHRNNYYLFMPQVHLNMGKNYSVQIGCGIERYSRGKFRPILGLRVVRQF